MGVAAAIGILGEGLARGHGGFSNVGDVALALAVAVCITVRRRSPVLSLAVTMGLLLLVLYLMHSTHTALAVAMLSAGTVAYQGRRRLSLVVGTALVPVVALAWRVAGGDGVGQEFFSYLVLLLAAVVGGDAVRSRRDAVAARAERELVAREAAARELFDGYRLQLARDLHDSVAHSLVAITTRAGVAAHLGRANGNPELLSALTDVKRVSADALHELRETLQMLRADGVSAPNRPRITSRQTLEGLVQPLGLAGLTVRLRCDPDTERAPSRVSNAGYRIVQESVTNVLRHADADTVSVSLAVEGGTLLIEVSNDGPPVGEPAAAALPRKGHGLLGMQERAHDVGGTVSAGPQLQGGWLVSARLPMSA
ncbi:histidine kinase [Acidothermaceae bacterium B102]|nr:histidine kinase [Acidothermaceae bacterium B102]